jgi:hypothetical protein
MRPCDRRGPGPGSEGAALSAPEDAVLAYWREHREQLRQSENQRAVLTNYVLAITGFIVSIKAQLRCPTTPTICGLYKSQACIRRRLWRRR